jgi:hypothetical protein
LHVVGNEGRSLPSAGIDHGIRPNLVVAGNHCLCFATETVPSEGIPAGSRCTFKAMAVCAVEDADRFAPNGPFELRDGPHVFAKGRIRAIFSRVENQPTA